MKNNNVLPLVALISGLLVGCGGGGGGGGGGAPAKTELEFNFVKAEQQDIGTSTASSCKIYDRERTKTSNNGVETTNTKILIAKPIKDSLNSFLSIVYSDKNGVVQPDSETYVSNGKVKFYLEDIPDGGYLSIKELFGVNNTYVTSFSKELLEAHKNELDDIVLTAVTAVPGLSCTAAGSSNLVEQTKSGIRYLNTKDDTQGDSAVLPFFFTSNIEQEQSNDSEITSGTGGTNFQSLSNDITLVTQYRQANSSASLFQYGFEDWASGNIEMSYTGDNQAILRPSTIPFTDTEIGIVYKETSKIISTIPNSDNQYFHPSTLRNGEQWFAQTAGVPQTHWTSSFTKPIDDSWNLNLDESDLFNVSSLSTPEVTLTNNSSGALQIDLSDNISIQESENGIQRISITPNTNLSAIQLHTMYSFVDETVILPNIAATDASDLTAFGLQQNYWFSKNDDDVSVLFVMDGFNSTAATDESVDSHGAMITEAERDRIYAQSNTVEHLSLQRRQ